MKILQAIHSKSFHLSNSIEPSHEYCCTSYLLFYNNREKIKLGIQILRANHQNEINV